MKYYIFISILFIMFTKELILINDELIIYIIFLSITVAFVKSFSFLGFTFETIQQDIKNNLVTLSKNIVVAEQLILLKEQLIKDSITWSLLPEITEES
jgi:hypothetical protein